MAAQGAKNTTKALLGAGRKTLVNSGRNTLKVGRGLVNIGAGGTKLTVSGLKNGFSRGVKTVQDLIGRIKSNLSFKKFRIRRQGRWFKLEGKLNPWVLLASGEIPEDLDKFNELRMQKIESVDSPEMKNIMRQLYKEKGGNARGKIVGDGSAMDALKNEIKTKRPTNGVWHDEKLRNQKNRLTKMINGEIVIKKDPVTGIKLKKKEWYNLELSQKDKKIASEILNEITELLNKIPAEGLPK